MKTKMWRLNRRISEGFVVINPEAIDQMYPNDNRSGTVIIMRSGRVLEVEELLGALPEHVELEIG